MLYSSVTKSNAAVYGQKSVAVYQEERERHTHTQVQECKIELPLRVKQICFTSVENKWKITVLSK